MNTYTLESFINFCDDMQIAEEGFNVISTLKTAIIKIRHMLKQLMMNFYKIGTYYVPKKVFDYIDKKLKDTENYEKWAFEYVNTNIGDTDTVYNSIKLVDDILKYDDRVSINWDELDKFRKADFSKLDFRKVQSSDIIKQMKVDDKNASRVESELKKLESNKNDEMTKIHNEEANAYRYELKIFNLRIRLYSELFKWNSKYNESSDTVNLKYKGEAVYDDPTNY